MRILHLVSCRGWSSDAYWAARVCTELQRRGHAVTLACREGTERLVIDRARAEGVERIQTLTLRSGFRPRADVADTRRLAALLRDADVVHAHRGKEHWLAVAAARLSGRPVPIVRTRHIVQAVRPHPGNRWLYGRATALVVAVTESIRRQCLAAGLLAADRIVTVRGGADAERYRPRPADPEMRRRLGADAAAPLIGLVGGLRTMKGHDVVLDAAARLGAAGLHPRFVFVGRGPMEARLRSAIARAGLADRVSLAGFAPDLPAVMAALDVGLYVPLESEGMSRVVFEYLAAGVPLVAARVGAAAEVLTDGVDAVVVPAGDAPALARALARVCADAALRERVAGAARRLVVERFSGARVAETIEAHYARVAA